MESEIRQSILKTVLYSDIFDYPTTAAQIWKYLISSRKIEREDFDKVLKNIKGPIKEQEGWYFLSGRENLIKKRLRRRKESQRKIAQAYKTASILSIIPTVLLIGVSGGTSMHNADKNDDIDFFIIARENTIWQTRFFSVLALTLLRRYRKRSLRIVADKICLNMLVDESGLTFPEDRQDLYTAHEIVQMKPIFNKHKTYEKFILANKWVENFLPNSIMINDKGFSSRAEVERMKSKQQQVATAYLLFAVEFLVKEIQLWYIKRHVTLETVSNEMLAFHPSDYKIKVMQAYEARLKKYEQKI